jgi:hypothetical protein
MSAGPLLIFWKKPRSAYVQAARKGAQFSVRVPPRVVRRRPAQRTGCPARDGGLRSRSELETPRIIVRAGYPYLQGLGLVHSALPRCHAATPGLETHCACHPAQNSPSPATPPRHRPTSCHKHTSLPQPYETSKTPALPSPFPNSCLNLPCLA